MCGMSEVVGSECAMDMAKEESADAASASQSGITAEEQPMITHASRQPMSIM